MRVRLALLLAVLAAPPATAIAQYYYPPPGPTETGINLSGRLGYGFPGGDIVTDFPTADAVDSKVPIWLELQLRFNRSLWGGLYLELAPAMVDSRYCVPGLSCSASDVRFGVDLQFHFAPYSGVDPWLGIGLGAEFLNATLDEEVSPGLFVQTDRSWSGLEFPLLEAGLDLAVTPRFTLGPFVALSISQFTGYSVQPAGDVTTSGSISSADRAVHTWLQLGVKGTIKL